jgi:murein DD-endopeptidase MepM/ murein hydrolase activator NlpD
MSAVRVRAVLVFLLLALVLTTTGCRGTSSGGAHGSSSGGLHLPWFGTSHEPDPEQSFVAEMKELTERFKSIQSNMPTDGKWAPPLAAPLRVTRPFLPPPAPYAAGHRGVDLAGAPRQEVRSAGTGWVTWAGVLAGRGVVVVQHRGLRTTYEPVAASVAKGDLVLAGDRIGSLQRGHPGCPVAACLHWGLLRGAEYLDPMSLLHHDVRPLPLGNR